MSVTRPILNVSARILSNEGKELGAMAHSVSCEIDQALQYIGDGIAMCIQRMKTDDVLSWRRIEMTIERGPE